MVCISLTTTVIVDFFIVVCECRSSLPRLAVMTSESISSFLLEYSSFKDNARAELSSMRDCTDEFLLEGMAKVDPKGTEVGHRIEAVLGRSAYVRRKKASKQ
ncbi:hypothetical protein RCL1_006410 [Eukaryota sp. TZLM3-RCL]